MEDEIDYIRNLQSKSLDIITPGYISNEERHNLYSNASIFVFPSHYEGFGMPILEAMQYGVPTAVSDIPVFHEVSAGSSLYFDKDSPDSIKNTVEKVLNSKETQKKLTSAGFDNLKRFSWKVNSSLIYKNILKITKS
jgi:glycosyltransferase involved in cell wall biosynthesis